MELVDKVCDNFDDYAQATRKSDGEPTLIRMTTHTGNMNPEFSQVDIVPDEELNTKLKFYVSTTGQIWLSLYIADSFVMDYFFLIEYCYFFLILLSSKNMDQEPSLKHFTKVDT